MTAAAMALSASCRKCLPIAASCGHRTKYGMFRSKWLMFAVSEGKLHMLNPEIFMTEVDSRFRGNDGLSRIQTTARQEESPVFN